MRIISYGGGVQSTALLVLATDNRLPGVDAALFSNVGDDSEEPATLKYVREVAVPFAHAHNLPLHELHRETKDGKVETLYGRITKPGHRAITIPLRGENGAPQSRHCTRDFKISVIGKWLKRAGASKTMPAEVCIGISTDELERAGRGQDEPHERRRYPLLELGLSRADCEQIIRNAGLPVPPKSACWFCPFHSPRAWSEMRRDESRHFEAAVALEGMVLARQRVLGHPPLYLTRFGKPLDEAIQAAQQMLWTEGPESCDEGYCWT